MWVRGSSRCFFFWPTPVWLKSTCNGRRAERLMRLISDSCGIRKAGTRAEATLFLLDKIKPKWTLGHRGSEREVEKEEGRRGILQPRSVRRVALFVETSEIFQMYSSPPLLLIKKQRTGSGPKNLDREEKRGRFLSAAFPPCSMLVRGDHIKHHPQIQPRPFVCHAHTSNIENRCFLA